MCVLEHLLYKVDIMIKLSPNTNNESKHLLNSDYIHAVLQKTLHTHTHTHRFTYIY